MRQYTVTVHTDGPALWPAHKSLDEVLKLRDTTPPLIWEGTYQGNPTPAGGYAFRREWWHEQNRHTIGEYENVSLARFQSWDTAEEAGDDNAYTVCVTGEILRDYRLVIRHVYRARLTFDALPQTIEALARQWNADNKLKMIVLEDMSSGRSAKHTLKATAPRWLRDRLHPLRPVGSKEARASAASVWCRNGMVMLPHPGPGAEWLLDFEDELFSFPQSAYKDQVDAFGQLIFYCQNYLAEGYKARRGKTI